MDKKAMYKLSYGLFVLTAKNGEKDNDEKKKGRRFFCIFLAISLIKYVISNHNTCVT